MTVDLVISAIFEHIDFQTRFICLCKGHTKFSVIWKPVLPSGESCEVTQENDMQYLKGAIQKIFCSVLRKQYGARDWKD
jgi:hypothetical protein